MVNLVGGAGKLAMLAIAEGTNARSYCSRFDTCDGGVILLLFYMLLFINEYCYYGYYGYYCYYGYCYYYCCYCCCPCCVVGLLGVMPKHIIGLIGLYWPSQFAALTNNVLEFCVVP